MRELLESIAARAHRSVAACVVSAGVESVRPQSHSTALQRLRSSSSSQRVMRPMMERRMERRAWRRCCLIHWQAATDWAAGRQREQRRDDRTAVERRPSRRRCERPSCSVAHSSRLCLVSSCVWLRVPACVLALACSSWPRSRSLRARPLIGARRCARRASSQASGTVMSGLT